MALSIQTDSRGTQTPDAVPLPRPFLDVYVEGTSCVVHVAGELDLTTKDQLFAVATVGKHPAMVIDVADVTFMDCSGFGALVASGLVINGDDRTLRIRGLTGQPAHLCDLIAKLERTPEPVG